MTSNQVSWGTKGSDKADALPSVKSKSSSGSGARTVEDTTKLQEDVDATFKETVTRALKKADTTEVIEKPTLDDDNKTFRTRLVIAWIMTNGILVIIVENINGWLNIYDEKITRAIIQRFMSEMASRRNNYFAFILYATFFLSIIRFLGVSCFQF